MRGRFASMCFFEVFCLQAYTAGVVIFFTTSLVNVLPNRSCSVSWKTMESPVIFTTYPLNTGSFSRRKYALFKLLVTTAMKPLSDFTTPRRLIVPISRHFFPVEHPEPFCCTTGLKNGSRFPLIAHFLSSGLLSLEALAASDFSAFVSALVSAFVSALASAAGAGAAGFISFATGLAGGFMGSALATTTAGFATAGLAAGAADFATTVFGWAAGASVLDGAGVFFATAGAAVVVPCVCRVRISWPASPG